MALAKLEWLNGITINSSKEFLRRLCVRPIGEKDLPEIDKLIAKNYTYDVPDRTIFRLTTEDIGNVDYELARIKIKDCASIGIFIEETEELVAVFFHTIHDKALNDSPTDVYLKPRNEKVAAYLRFSSFVEGDIFGDLNTSKFMMISMGCVKSKYRCLGILEVIDQIQPEIARSMGCEYLVAEAVSSYTEKAALKDGYKLLREEKFADYIDALTGKKPDLNLSTVHTSSMLLFKKIMPFGKVSNII